MKGNRGKFVGRSKTGRSEKNFKAPPASGAKNTPGGPSRLSKGSKSTADSKSKY